MSSAEGSQTGKHSNAQFSNPTPYQLRSLVLDYLCHQCYIKTARAFARDSTVRHLDADGDEIQSNKGPTGESSGLSASFLEHIGLREKIREHILSGRVDDATDILNKHFPAVLSGPALESVDEVHLPVPNDMEYIASTSVDPAHLTLNLRIMSFIEACRTIPLEHPLTDTSSSKETDTKPTALVHNQMNLLLKAQKLHALASVLPKPSDRVIYLKELNNVGGLLAYKIPEASSISRYLSQERREALADQINSAILHRSALPSTSSLELLTRYTSTLWFFAHQHGIKARPGVPIPPSITTQELPSSGHEVVPMFDLHHFLDVKN